MTTNNQYRGGWNFDAEEDHYTVLPQAVQPQKKLPAGAYELNISISGYHASRVELKDEELILFEDGPHRKILGEIKKFWSIQDRYEKLGVPYRRGILMHGPPGTGKSGIVRIICEQIIANDGLVIIVKDCGRFTQWLPTLNQMEPERNIVVILEDVDELYCYDEQEFLQMLDGIGNDRPGLVFVATTNYLKAIPNRVYRPSRFDLLIEVEAPCSAVREQYVRDLCQRYEVDYREDIVEKSAGLSFAHLKETLVSCLLYDYPIDDVIKRMKKHAVLDDEEEE